MAKPHRELLADAKRAADKVFADTSVSRETTQNSLEELVEHIKDMLATLEG